MSPSDDAVRLQLVIAKSGKASRRAAEDMIRQGRVRVNGVVVTELGSKARLSDTIQLDGLTLRAETKLRYIALHKPRGYLCAMSDEFGRPLAVSLLKPTIPERVYNVGRLDLDSSGLIVFTNDGAFAAALSHPRGGLVKRYEVKTNADIPDDFPKAFINGISDDGETLKAKSVSIREPRLCVIRLVEGKKREIRRALAVFGLRAVALKRVAIGGLELGNLPEGAWRPLTPVEIGMLGGTH